MRTLLVLTALAVLTASGVPLAAALAPGLSAAEALVLGAGLSLGLFTLALGWLGLLPGSPLSGWGVAVAFGLVVAAGLLAARRSRQKSPVSGATRELASLAPGAPARWALALVIAFLAAASVLALHFPALHWDFLGRYGLHGRTLWREGRLVPEVFGYPPLVALFYAAVYATLGEVDEGLAKIQGPTFGALLLLTVLFLARAAGASRAAAAAVLLVGLSPAFLNSVPCGDPDLALAFYATASLHLIMRAPYFDGGCPGVLLGLLLGFALLSKQAAVPFLASLVILAALAAWGAWTRRGVTAGRLLSAGAIACIVAGPWYARNLILGGRLLDLANVNDMARSDRGLPSLLMMRWWPELGTLGAAFLLMGLVEIALTTLEAPGPGRRGVTLQARALAVALILVPVSLSGAVAFRGSGWPPFDRYVVEGALLFACALAIAGGSTRVAVASRPALLAGWILPLLLTFWARFSYTARYLLPVLPAIAVASARAGFRSLGSPLRRLPAAWPVVLGLVALLAWEDYPLLGLRLARVVAEPRSSKEQRWEHYPGAVYRAARWIAENRTAESIVVATNDGRLAYFLAPRDRTAPLPRTVDEARGCDFVLVGDIGEAADQPAGAVRELLAPTRGLLARWPPVFSCDGYTLHRTGSPATRSAGSRRPARCREVCTR